MADSAAVQAIFDEIPNRFDADKAKGVTKTIQWSLTGEGGGDWNVNLADGTCTVGEGPAQSPNMTMTLAADDFVGLMTGALNGQQLFMSGKLKISGDMMLAMQMQTWFRRD